MKGRGEEQDVTVSKRFRKQYVVTIVIQKYYENTSCSELLNLLPGDQYKLFNYHIKFTYVNLHRNVFEDALKRIYCLNENKLFSITIYLSIYLYIYISICETFMCNSRKLLAINLNKFNVQLKRKNCLFNFDLSKL